MNVRKSVDPIRERILNRTHGTLRISVQKTLFYFINPWTKEKLFVCTPWRQRIWRNWRYSYSILTLHCARRMVSVSSQQLYHQGTQWIWSWVDHRAGVDVLGSSCPCQGSKDDLPGVQPVPQSLYRTCHMKYKNWTSSAHVVPAQYAAHNDARQFGPTKAGASLVIKAQVRFFHNVPQISAISFGNRRHSWTAAECNAIMTK